MSLRTTAVLDTTFPYDSVEENGEFVFYAGRNISEMIAAQLEVRGYKVRDIQHRQEMGWAVVVQSERNYIGVLVAIVDEVYISVTYTPNFGDRLLGRKDEVYRPLLRDLDAILRADDRFSNIRWMAAGAEGPEFEHPID